MPFINPISICYNLHVKCLQKEVLMLNISRKIDFLTQYSFVTEKIRKLVNLIDSCAYRISVNTINYARNESNFIIYVRV